MSDKDKDKQQTQAIEPHQPRQIEQHVEQPRASALSGATVGRRGLELATFEEMWGFAKAALASGLVPKDVKTPATALIIIQHGAELGMPPMASLRNIAVINGRPSVWGDMALALCRQSGVFDERVFKEWIETTEDGPTAFCTVRRLPNGQPHTERFSMSDAITAKLNKKSGPWTEYPRRMLQMRARSWALRDRFNDVLGGLSIREEAMDIEPDQPLEASPGWAALGKEAADEPTEAARVVADSDARASESREQEAGEGDGREAGQDVEQGA